MPGVGIVAVAEEALADACGPRGWPGGGATGGDAAGAGFDVVDSVLAGATDEVASEGAASAGTTVD